MKQVYITLIAIVRDQERYVKEWLTFHHVVGVERFIIILHKCKDETESRIRELPFVKDIYIHHVIDETVVSVQLGAYHWAVQKYGHCSKWLLFLDTDEFMFGTEEDSLSTILNRYEDYGGLAVHLLHFGSNNHVLRSEELSIEAFIQRKSDNYDMNRAVKSFIQTKQLVALLSPHIQMTLTPVVREHFDSIGETHWGSSKKPTFDIVRCNHYHTRSMEDWVERRKRGSCNTYHEGNALYDITRFIERNTGEMEYDRTILRFTDKILETVR
jgi:hypothetical protein